MAKKVQFKDEANVKAAAQEAEERKLKRKQSFRKADGTSESRGVSFDDSMQDEEVMDEETTGEVAELVETASDDKILDSTPHKETVPLESLEKGKQRTIKIVSDGTFANTSVYIGTSKLRNPDISIRISKETGVQVVFLKEESLF